MAAMKNIVIGFSVLFSLSASLAAADSLAPFHQRFELVRDEAGRLERVMLKSPEVQMERYISELGLLVTELHNNPNFDIKAVSELLEAQDWDGDQIQIVARAIHRLKGEDLGRSFQDPNLQRVLKEVEAEMNLEIFEFATVARPYSKLFFYRSEFAKRFIMWAIDFASSQISTNPAFDLAKYLIYRMVEFGFQRRIYFQRYFLHFLETHGPSALGLNEEEAQLVRSSIYEAQIEWYQIWKVQKAKRNWENYGANELEREKQICADRERDDSAQGLNFIFSESGQSQDLKVFNLLDAKRAFSSAPSLAYSEKHPDGLLIQRILFEVIKLGLDLAPIPGLALTPFNWLINSMYTEQIESEGALLAYLDSNGDQKRSRVIRRQSLNPFVKELGSTHQGQDLFWAPLRSALK